jgi:two-component system chemotaxis response regulator CheY
MRVLVVDDSPFAGGLIKEAFEALGWEVVYEDKSLNFLETFQKIKPDLVSLDIVMPERNGVECYSLLRQISSTPVIMISCLSQNTSIQAAFTPPLPSYAFLEKPISLELLKEALAKINELSKVS